MLRTSSINLWAALLLAATPFAALAQTGGVGIGTTAPDVSAALDIVSSTKGALLPRVADAAALATPATGLLVFQTNAPVGFYYNAGTPAAPSWQRLATGSGGAAGDNLGNHTATQDLNLQGNALVGTGSTVGSTVGVGVRADGGLNLGENNSDNVLLGYQAGDVNNSFSSVFVGSQAGLVNTTGFNNVYLGTRSGLANTTGINNTFSGNFSGSRNTTGSYNVFSGGASGRYNTTGSNNTALGYGSGPANGSGNLSNATALGAGVALTTSNTVVLGNGASVGIGTPAPTQKLDVDGQVRVRGLSGADTRLPVVLPDGTLSVSAPVFSTPATTPAYTIAPTGSVGTGNVPISVAVSGPTAYVVNYNGNTLQTFNVANPASPVLLATVATGSAPYSVAVSGTTAYVVNFSSNTLQAFNVANPASPVLLATVATGTVPTSVAVSGTTAYVTNGNSNTLQAFNVANPASPVSLGSVATGSSPYSVAVSGTTAYVVNSGGNTLQAFNVANPASPVLLATVATGRSPQSVAVSGTTVCVANYGGNTLQTFNVANPASPVLLATVATGNIPFSVAVSGTTAYVANFGSDNLQAFSVANPASPALLATVATGTVPTGVAASGTTVYVTSGVDNTLQLFTIPPVSRVVTVNANGSLGSVALDFIRNGTAPQPNTDFNISGTGTVGGLLTAGSALVSGNVGIGTSAAPAARLEVVGDVRIPAANGYTYASPRAKTVLLGAFDFQAENGATATTLVGSSDERYPPATSSGVFRAPLHLPQGAIITGITLLAYDLNFYSLTAELIAYQATGSASAPRLALATASTTGLPEYTAVSSGTIAALVDNDNTAYSVRVTFGAGAPTLTLRGVKVSYTIAQAE